MKELKMFKYEGNEELINKYRENIDFTSLFELSRELDFSMENLGKSFEQFIFEHFGFNYWKREEVIAIALDLISLY